MIRAWEAKREARILTSEDALGLKEKSRPKMDRLSKLRVNQEA
jgi:hypothetical protein